MFRMVEVSALSVECVHLISWHSPPSFVSLPAYQSAYSEVVSDWRTSSVDTRMDLNDLSLETCGNVNMDLKALYIS